VKHPITQQIYFNKDSKSSVSNRTYVFLVLLGPNPHEAGLQSEHHVPQRGKNFQSIPKLWGQYLMIFIYIIYIYAKYAKLAWSKKRQISAIIQICALTWVCGTTCTLPWNALELMAIFFPHPYFCICPVQTLQKHMQISNDAITLRFLWPLGTCACFPKSERR